MGSTKRVTRKTLRRCTAIMRSHSSMAMSSTLLVAAMPALLTRMSMPPSAATLPPDQLRDSIGFAHVGLDGFALASCGTHLFGDFLGRFLLLRRRIVNDDVRTFPREG